MAEEKVKYTSDQLVRMLRDRYAGDAYAVFEQVANATGRNCGTWIDAIVLSLWPSNGLHRMAFEIKVSRSDFLRELQDPTKNAFFKSAVHQFWYVAPKDVIKEEELPEGMGWLAPRGEGLAIVRHAAHKADPKINDSFLAALARSMQKAHVVDNRDLVARTLESSTEHQAALEWKKAASRYLTEKGQRCYGGEEAIYASLNATTADTKSEKEREQLEYALEAFRRQISELLPFMALLADKSLLARDEMGEFIVHHWGADKNLSKRISTPEKKSFKELQAYLKRLNTGDEQVA